MLKCMIFIDGSWLFKSKFAIREVIGIDDFEIDFKKLPTVIQKHINKFLSSEVDIVRTHFFGSIPINRPGYDSSSQRAFYDMLAESCNYQTEIYDIDYRQDLYSRPKEKCVDVALASNVLFYAAISHAYDIAVLIAGDYDYLPLLKRVRLLGKRTLLVGLKSVDPAKPSPTSNKLLNDVNLFDLPVLFLNDYLLDIQLRYEQKLRQCDSCGKTKATTFQGYPFYCDECRTQHSKKHYDTERTCDTCGKVEKTNWAGRYFYCTDCREEFNSNRYSSFGNKPGAGNSG